MIINEKVDFLSELKLFTVRASVLFTKLNTTKDKLKVLKTGCCALFVIIVYYLIHQEIAPSSIQ